MREKNIIFRVSTVVALVGWICLILFPGSKMADCIVKYIVVVLLALVYGYLVLAKKRDTQGETPKGNFLSLQGVVLLFKNPRVVLAGWIHYLAFDLMVGLYIMNDSLQKGINYWLALPFVLITMVLGPLGYLGYFILVMFYTI